MTINTANLILTLSPDYTHLASLRDGSRELLADTQPQLFTLRARRPDGEAVYFSSDEAIVTADNSTITYAFENLRVKLTVDGGDSICWRFTVENRSDLAVEYIDLPNVRFAGRLKKNGGDCAIVSSYNEGLYVDDSTKKRSMTDPEFPSQGGYMMYPYMLSTPIMMWLYGEQGILMSVEDIAASPCGLDFCCGDDSTEFRIRLFLGGEPGGDIANDVAVKWTRFEGDWTDGAAIWRDRLYQLTDNGNETTAQFGAKYLSNIDLPDWYKNDMPLVLTYPVRGIHDMDKMDPNKLFPYINALPYVDEFARRTGAKIMVLLMHWEGTAPWAPPYVWPPYGGEEGFREFMDELHRRGQLLGVYCSGLGFTEQSNLIAEYNLSDRISSKRLDRGFCLAPGGKLIHSRICTGQRSGYDICPASEVGKKLLDDALEPLLASGVDYVQALDQNHGGGMYFCYAPDHGHPPVPGSWMTKASRELLDGWKKSCPDTLLGCESAAAEPYISDLRLSDCRYELCYFLGSPIPLYSFLYHRWLHNFMGNQVCCPVGYTTEGLCMRIAYSFAAGDMITLVLNDDGEIMFHWGMRDFSRVPDRDTVIGFCAELTRWHKLYPALFYNAEMLKPIKYDCDEVEIGMLDGSTRCERALFSTAWKLAPTASDGKCRTVQLFVNHTSEPRLCKVELDNSASHRGIFLRGADGSLTKIDPRVGFTVNSYSCAAIEY